MFVSRTSGAVQGADKSAESERFHFPHGDVSTFGGATFKDPAVSLVDVSVPPVAVSRLAVDVMARLSARDGRADVDMIPHDGFVEKLRACARGVERLSYDALKPEMRRVRISAAGLADVYIPHVARLLGREWEEDSLSFAQVTMGVARLQMLLREVSADWSADECQLLTSRAQPGLGGGARAVAARVGHYPRDTAVLVLVPGDEQHTLGPMVLTSQLRRMGISVCLRLQPSSAALTALLRKGRFECAIVSVGGEGKLEAAQNMVNLLKSLTRGQLRVAVGGAAVEKIKTLGVFAGADVVTNDLEAALRILGVARITLCADERV